ncbi:MAG: LemA family protein [Planctomycetes bacterium]|nr:LemA family protein [Planctomycetota bacterium]
MNSSSWALSGLFIAIAVAAFVVLVVIVILYNGLAVRRVRMANAFSQIDVQLRRRSDLIPNLIETVKGYMQHERGTLEAVIKARGEVDAASGNVAAGNLGAIGALSTASAALGSALGGLFARVEAYPDLKANAQFLSLQEQLVSTENRVAFARQAFNDSVMRYNEAVVTFPGNLIAGVFRFQRAEQWTTTEESRALPTVRVSG